MIDCLFDESWVESNSPWKERYSNANKNLFSSLLWKKKSICTSLTCFFLVLLRTLLVNTFNPLFVEERKSRKTIVCMGSDAPHVLRDISII